MEKDGDETHQEREGSTCSSSGSNRGRCGDTSAESLTLCTGERPGGTGRAEEEEEEAVEEGEKGHWCTRWAYICCAHDAGGKDRLRATSLGFPVAERFCPCFLVCLSSCRSVYIAFSQCRVERLTYHDRESSIPLLNSQPQPAHLSGVSTSPHHTPSPSQLTISTITPPRCVDSGRSEQCDFTAATATLLAIPLVSAMLPSCATSIHECALCWCRAPFRCIAYAATRPRRVPAATRRVCVRRHARGRLGLLRPQSACGVRSRVSRDSADGIRQKGGDDEAVDASRSLHPSAACPSPCDGCVNCATAWSVGGVACKHSLDAGETAGGEGCQ